MRLDAARITESLCRRCALQWPIHQDTKSASYLDLKGQTFSHPENFFPRFLRCRMPRAPDGAIARNADAESARIDSG
jgi:hypothetical protein